MSVVAVGDSLSNGFDACSDYGECPRVSWATGDDPSVDSVASRLEAASGRPAAVTNVARAGATASDLGRQVALAAAAAPDLVTVLIGANDVCRARLEDMTPVADYRALVSAALDGLAGDAASAVVLVASVPDVTALIDVAGSDDTARFLWSRTRACGTVLRDPRSDSPAAEARRAAVRERIGEYNAALAEVCGAVERCVFDDGALSGYRPELGQLSALDFFHPSLRGLRELAALEWGALRAAPAARDLIAAAAP